MTNQRQRRFLAFVIGAALLLGVGGVSWDLVDTDGDGQGDTPSVRLVPKKDTPAERELDVTPPPGEFDANRAGPPLSGDLDDVPGLSEADEADVREANEAAEDAKDDLAGVLENGASPELSAVRKCPTNRNGGARPLSDVLVGVVHVTVSLNRVGLSDGDALCDFFRNVKASPTWTVDNEGNRWENVRLGLVPWTQVAFNRRSCSIEFVGSTGRVGEGPAQWTDVQLRAGAELMAYCFRKARIPVRLGATSGAVVTRSGVVTHQSLGIAGGGHTDPGPFFNMARYLDWMRFYATGGKPKACEQRNAECRYPDLAKLTPEERANAKRLLLERRVAARAGGWAKVDGRHLERARAAKRWLVGRAGELRRLGSPATNRRGVRLGVIRRVVAAA